MDPDKRSAKFKVLRCQTDRVSGQESRLYIFFKTNSVHMPQHSLAAQKHAVLEMYTLELVVQRDPERRGVEDPLYIITCSYELTPRQGPVAAAAIVKEGSVRCATLSFSCGHAVEVSQTLHLVQSREDFQHRRRLVVYFPLSQT